MGLAPAIHPALAADAETAALVTRADRTVKQLHMLEEVRLWRLRLVCLARNLEPEQLAVWTERLKLRGADAAVIAGGVVLAPKVLERLGGTELSRSTVYDLLARRPAGGLVLAYERAGEGRVRATPALELT